MQGPRFNQAKEAVYAVLKTLTHVDFIGIVAVSQYIQVLIPALMSLSAVRQQS